MVSFSRFASIACLLGVALSQSSDEDYCSLNYTLTLNITTADATTSCTRGDGVMAYTDPEGGCCLTLDFETCVASETCVFVNFYDTCGVCISVDFANSEFNLTGSTCEEDAEEWVMKNPEQAFFMNMMCNATMELDCCWEGNMPTFNWTDECSGLDADTCVFEGEDSTCALFYSPLVDCYNCLPTIPGMTCADAITYYGAMNITVYCDSSVAEGSSKCQNLFTTEPATSYEPTDSVDSDTTSVGSVDTTDGDTTSTTEDESDDPNTAAQVYLVVAMFVTAVATLMA